MLVKDVPAFLDSPKLAVLSQLSDADGAVQAAHGLLVVEEVDDCIVARGWRALPVSDCFGEDDEHAAEGESHDGKRVDEVVHVYNGLLFLHILLVQLVNQFLFRRFLARTGLSEEDREEDEEKEGEGGEYLVVEAVQLEQEGQEEGEEDMNVEKTLQLRYVFLLKLIPLRMQHLVDPIAADCDRSVNC